MLTVPVDKNKWQIEEISKLSMLYLTLPRKRDNAPIIDIRRKLWRGIFPANFLTKIARLFKYEMTQYSTAMDRKIVQIEFSLKITLKASAFRPKQEARKCQSHQKINVYGNS